MTQRLWIYAAAGIVGISGLAIAILLRSTCGFQPFVGIVCERHWASRVLVAGFGLALAALLAGWGARQSSD